jgi:hypothetical protein
VETLDPLIDVLIKLTGAVSRITYRQNSTEDRAQPTGNGTN